jgi:Uncharacterized protein conserved in bacteria (DUF2066)
MRSFILGLCLLLGLLARPALGQRFADMFSVDAIDVDVVGPTAEDARVGAFREAAKKGWGRLWDKLVDPGYRGKAPPISNAEVYRVVSAFDVSSERMSATRYIARFNITFDPAAVRSALARGGAGYTQARNRSMLLIPLLEEGGAASVYEADNAWAQAWGRFPLIRSSIDYIRADGTLADTVMLNPAVTRYRSAEAVQALLARYRADGMVVAKAVVTRTYPGGPVTGRFMASTGSNPAALDSFTLARRTDAQLGEMFEEAIRRLDVAFSAFAKPERAQIAGPVQLGRAVAVGGTLVLVSTPDAASLASWQQRLRSVRTIGGVTVSELSLGGTSKLRIAANQGRDWLLYELDQRGLRMEADGFMRERLPGDPPIARPKTAEELEAERVSTAGAEPAPPGAPTLPKKPEVMKEAAPVSLLPGQ